MKPVLLITSSLFALSLANSAHAMNSRIVCTYLSHSGSLAEVTFDGPEGVDLADPHQITIPLKINGAETAEFFDVNSSPSNEGRLVTYSYRSPVFANSISLIYRVRDNSEPLFTGTWSSDTPPSLKLKCAFASPDL